MPRRFGPLADERGMTLVELMVAAFVLVVGILGVVSLVERANGAIGNSNARVGATNLARDLVEGTHSVDYDDVTTGRLPALLHSKTGVPGTANPWKVVRRNIEYTVTVKACLFDDPTDGLAPTTFDTGDAALPMCARPTALNSDQDKNPDDFRRVQLDLTWRRGGAPFHLSQDALIVNPSGGLGPRMLSFPVPATQFTSNSIDISGLTSTTAKTVRWNVADASGGGDATLVSTSPNSTWKLSWPLGTSSNPPYVYDGVYQLTAQAFNSVGVPGNALAAQVYLNRYLPLAPADAVGGRNTSGGSTFVDLRWSPNPEHDVIGYRVRRLEPNGSWTQICPTSSGGVLTQTSCIDPNPPGSGAITYAVVALDRQNLMDPSSQIREGTAATVTVADAAAQPASPTALTASGVEGGTQLTWTEPGGVTGIAFFRIYRDGIAITDRYASTVTNNTYWIDSNPGAGSHTYRVTAVNTALNESPLSDPVSYP